MEHIKLELAQDERSEQEEPIDYYGCPICGHTAIIEVEDGFTCPCGETIITEVRIDLEDANDVKRLEKVDLENVWIITDVVDEEEFLEGDLS